MGARHLLLSACNCAGLLLAVQGCQNRAQQPAPPEPPAVSVSQPVSREVTDYVDFTGRTQAINSVNIVPRATGYLVLPPDKKQFKEGSEVKTGDLLFLVDPRPYQAQYDQAMGQVNLYKAQLKLAQVTRARDTKVIKETPGAVSAQQLDQDKAAEDEANAQVKAAEATLETYKLNLEFCRVISPIDGQISRYYLTYGNLVTQDQTLLTTVVSLDPIFAYVDVDEPTVLRVRRAINEGRIKAYDREHIPILMELQGETGYPRKGVIDFVNNQVNPTTGSMLVRGVFDNPLPPGGRRLIMPGMFVQIRLPIGQPHKSLLVIDRAIGSDQGLKYVYVVADNKIKYVSVDTGALQSDGLRVVNSGLNENDKVVTTGLQQLHPDMEVHGNVEPMPTIDVSRGQSPELAPGEVPKGSVPESAGPDKSQSSNSPPANSSGPK